MCSVPSDRHFLVLTPFAAKFTYEATAGSVTSFHYRDLQPDYENGAFGGQIGKLLMRHFPKAYTYNSVYALFPFTTPAVNKQILIELGIAHKYDFTPPAESTSWVEVKSYKEAERVFTDSDSFSNVYGPALAEMTRKHETGLLDYLSLSTSPKSSESFSKVIDATFYSGQWSTAIYPDLAKLVKKHLGATAFQDCSPHGRHCRRRDRAGRDRGSSRTSLASRSSWRTTRSGGSP